MLTKFLAKSKKGFTLVELMIVVAIIGILAAIAIPAFLRYIKQSKTSEAEAIMKKMAEGSKSYFTSEQKYSPADGDQRWHAPGATATTVAGLPVVFDSYVFPGGAGFVMNTSVSGCASGTAGQNAPEGGSKQIPCQGTFPASGTVTNGALNKLRVVLQDPLYFEYHYATGTGTGEAADATIIATADFNPGTTSTTKHNITQIIDIDSVTQEVKVGPSVVRNEFE